MRRIDFAMGLLSTMLANNRKQERAGRLAVMPQMVILHMSRDPQRWHTTGEIIKAVDIQSSSLAQLLYPAVQEAFLRRRPSGEARGFEYQLAEKGKAVAAQLLNPTLVPAHS